MTTRRGLAPSAVPRAIAIVRISVVVASTG
jgi:hypothetical protein